MRTKGRNIRTPNFSWRPAWTIRPDVRSTVTSLFTGERNRRVAMAAAAGVAQRSVAIVGTFLMFPRVLHALGTDQFGVWGAATSLAMLVAIADFGVGPAIVTLVAHAIASEERDKPREYFTAALMMACSISLILAVTGTLAAFLIAPKPQLPVYLIAVAGVAINVPLGSAQSTWLALQRGWMAAFWDFVQTVFLIGGLALAVHYSNDLQVYVGVVYAALLAASATNMTCLLISHPELRPVAWIAPVEQIKTVMKTGLRYFMLSALDALSYMLDNIIALQLLGGTASAQMLIAQRVCIAANGLLMMVAQPLWPAFIDAAARGDRRWIFRALVRGSLLVTATAIAGSSIIVLFGPMLLKLWLKTNVGLDRSILWAMALWIVSFSLVRIQVLLLNALRITGFQIRGFALATVISLILKFVLAPRYGVAGILIATAVTFPFVVFPAILWRVTRWRQDVSQPSNGGPVGAP